MQVKFGNVEYQYHESLFIAIILEQQKMIKKLITQISGNKQ